MVHGISIRIEESQIQPGRLNNPFLRGGCLVISNHFLCRVFFNHPIETTIKKLAVWIFFWKLSIFPKNETIVFQPSIFRCYVILVSGRVFLLGLVMIWNRPIETTIKNLALFWSSWKLHPRSLTWPLKNGDWKTILSYWEGNFSGANC